MNYEEELVNDPAYVIDAATGEEKAKLAEQQWASFDQTQAFAEHRVHRAANVPARYRKAAPTEPTVERWVKSIVEHAKKNDPKRIAPEVTEGPSLLIIGSVGTGKTYQCYGALRALHLAGLRGAFTYGLLATIINDIRAADFSEAKDRVKRLRETNLLMLDDVGYSRHTEYSEEVVFEVLNYRYENFLPTLVTTNVKGQAELDAHLGPRLTERLLQMAHPLVLDNESRRQNARDDWSI